jgi:hypothetical protein
MLRRKDSEANWRKRDANLVGALLSRGPLIRAHTLVGKWEAMPWTAVRLQLISLPLSGANVEQSKVNDHI